jgi:hypothetical protein
MTFLKSRDVYPALEGVHYDGPFNAGSGDLSTIVSNSADSTGSRALVPSVFCHDKPVFLDAAWVRDEGEAALRAQVRILRVNAGQKPETAEGLLQWVTDWIYWPDVANYTAESFNLIHTRGANPNRIEAFGRLYYVFDQPVPGLLDAVIAFRWREYTP